MIWTSIVTAVEGEPNATNVPIRLQYPSMASRRSKLATSSTVSPCSTLHGYLVAKRWLVHGNSVEEDDFRENYGGVGVNLNVVGCVFRAVL